MQQTCSVRKEGNEPCVDEGVGCFMDVNQHILNTSVLTSSNGDSLPFRDSSSPYNFNEALHKNGNWVVSPQNWSHNPVI